MDYEAEYDNIGRVPDHAEKIADWLRWSEETRTALSEHAEFDLSYAETSERTRLDLFWPAQGADTASMAIFVHGGYWRARDRKDFSFAARGAVANGVAVAIPSYDLCPHVPLGRIVEDVRLACAWLFRRHRRRFAVCGHSAGGHLTAAMMTTDWKAVDPALPDDLVTHGLPISGMFELESLLETSINDDLHLTADEARQLSPLYETPVAGAQVDLVVGGDESTTFIRQSRDLAHRWTEKGASVSMEAPAGADHFTVVNPLADPDSTLTGNLVDLARNAAAI